MSETVTPAAPAPEAPAPTAPAPVPCSPFQHEELIRRLSTCIYSQVADIMSRTGVNNGIEENKEEQGSYWLGTGDKKTAETHLVRSLFNRPTKMFMIAVPEVLFVEKPEATRLLLATWKNPFSVLDFLDGTIRARPGFVFCVDDDPKWMTDDEVGGPDPKSSAAAEVTAAVDDYEVVAGTLDDPGHVTQSVHQDGAITWTKTVYPKRIKKKKTPGWKAEFDNKYQPLTPEQKAELEKKIATVESAPVSTPPPEAVVEEKK